MRFPRLVATLPLALAATLAAAAPPPSPAAPLVVGPRAKYETADVDTGSVPRGRTVEAVFVVRNVGDQPLKLLSVRPG